MTNNFLMHSSGGVAAITDSLMSTDKEKKSGSQKIFAINNNLVLIAGDVVGTDSVLDNANFTNKKTPLSLAEEIIETYFRVFAKHEPFAIFTICGFDEKEKKYVIIKTDLPLKKVPTIIKENYVMEGSGAHFVNHAIKRDYEKGILLVSKKLEDLVYYVYDFGKAAQKSSWVDDVYQFGIIKNTTPLLLLDPEVNYSNETIKEEVNDIGFAILKENLQWRSYFEKVFNFNNISDFYNIDSKKRYHYSSELNDALREHTRQIIELCFEDNEQKIITFKNNFHSVLVAKSQELYDINSQLTKIIFP